MVQFDGAKDPSAQNRLRSGGDSLSRGRERTRCRLEGNEHALSDFAAMSGIPEFALVALAIAGKKKASWVDELYRGLNRAAARFDVAIVGGETSETVGPTVIVVSVAGGVERDRCVLRSGGKASDDLSSPEDWVVRFGGDV